MNNFLLVVLVGGFVLILAKVILAFRSDSTLSSAHAGTVVAAAKQAQEWLNIGEKSKSPTEKMVSYTRALAFLNAIRLTVKDETIEKTAKINVTSLVKKLQGLQRSAVTAVDPKLESFASSFVIR